MVVEIKDVYLFCTRNGTTTTEKKKKKKDVSESHEVKTFSSRSELHNVGMYIRKVHHVFRSFRCILAY